MADHFVPDLPLLREQLLSGINDHDKIRARVASLSHLPHLLGLCRVAFWELCEHQRRAVESVLPRFGQPKPNYVESVEVQPNERELVAHAIDAYFDAARRAQNAVIPYLRYRFRLSLPASMNALQQDIRKSRSRLPHDVGVEILNYWDSTGHIVKDYRDVAQHVAIISSDVHAVRFPNGDVGIYVTLPNNPSCKSAERLSFKPPVHPIDVIPNTLGGLLSFLGRLTQMLVQRPLPQTRKLVIPVSVDPGKFRLMQRLMDDAQVSALFAEILSDARAASTR